LYRYFLFLSHSHTYIYSHFSIIQEQEAEPKSLGQQIFEAYEKTANVATTLFPLWTVLFTAWALRAPQAFSWFTTEYFTAGLAALMLSMGITLTPQDFVKVAQRPNAVIMQFALCYGMMPVLALALGKAFSLNPALVAGMVLVGSINGGQASNLCTYIARGNVALSVLMTTATTLGAIVMTPLLCKGLLGAVVPVDATGIAVSTIQVSSSEETACCMRQEEAEIIHLPFYFHRSSWLPLLLA
jgi:BASS family bile acid:Na+ symporter